MSRLSLVLAATVIAGCHDPVQSSPTVTTSEVGATPSYEIVDLGSLGAPISNLYPYSTTAARAINHRGQIVGSSLTASGATHAFVWEDGEMRDLGTLGGDFSMAYAINSRGNVAGVSKDSAGAARVALWTNNSVLDIGPTFPDSFSFFRRVYLSEDGHVAWSAPTPTGQHAQLWFHGVVTDLGSLGGNVSYPVGVNSLGQVSGTSTLATGEEHAFRWAGGVMQDLGTLRAGGAGYSRAFAMNERGQVTGITVIDSGPPESPFLHYQRGFLWTEGQMTDLGTLWQDCCSQGKAINENGQVAGESYSGLGYDLVEAFLWDAGVTRPVGRDTLSFPRWDRVSGLNDLGQVVGAIKNPMGGPPKGGYHARLWENGTTTDLGTIPDGWQSSALAINNRGDIIGWAYRQSDGFHAVLWRRLGDDPNLVVQ